MNTSMSIYEVLISLHVSNKTHVVYIENTMKWLNWNQNFILLRHFRRKNALLQVSWYPTACLLWIFDNLVEHLRWKLDNWSVDLINEMKILKLSLLTYFMNILGSNKMRSRCSSYLRRVYIFFIIFLKFHFHTKQYVQKLYKTNR